MKNRTIEAEARRLLADKLDRLPWWPGMSDAARRSAAQADVDRYWPVMASEAGEAVAARLEAAENARADPSKRYDHVSRMAA